LFKAKNGICQEGLTHLSLRLIKVNATEFTVVKEVLLYRIMKKLRWPTILMMIAIIAVTGFQAYWLKNNYDREKQSLEIRTNSSFRQTILRLQSAKLKLDRWNVRSDSTYVSGTVSRDRGNKRNSSPAKQRIQPINLVTLIQEKMLDSLRRYDSAGGLPVMAIRGSSHHNLYFDSAIKGDAKTFISLSDKTDSLILDPAMTGK
jgi:hypothetical protein